MLFLNTFVPALKEASSEVQGALQQTKPGVDSKSISYLLCSDRQHPVGTCMTRLRNIANILDYTNLPGWRTLALEDVGAVKSSVR